MITIVTRVPLKGDCLFKALMEVKEYDCRKISVCFMQYANRLHFDL